MLALLAALIPIAGSLFVAASFLWDQTRLSHEHRVRRRIAQRANEYYERVRDEVGLGLRRGDHSTAGQEKDRFTRMLLRVNGLPENRGTYTDIEVRIAMSGRVEGRSELVRQWVLLLTSALGLVLLAFDLM